MKKFVITFTLLFTLNGFAQNDLLNQIDSDESKAPISAAFKGMKIVNLESTKLLSKKELYLVIAHRFGSIKDGFEGFFGLDNAVTQIKFIYGITDKISLSAARSEQAFDFSGKYLIASQRENGFPVTIVGFNSIGFNNYVKPSLIENYKSSHKLIYTNQILVSRKFSDKFSLELAPTHFHENYTFTVDQDNSQFAIGMGGRYKISKRISINADYAAHLNRASNSDFKNPLSVGVDIETGGHVFQMHFTNSQGIHEVGYLGNSTGDWTKGDIFFGFNLVRTF